MIHQELEVILKPVVEDLGCELWACEYLVQGKHSMVRIYIDKPEGIHIEDCEKVSREVSVLLDVQEPITGNYTLEVSSPGMDRPLFKVSHFQRYLGSDITVKVRHPILINGTVKRRKFIGKLIEVKNNNSEEEFSGNIIISEDNEMRAIPIVDIVKANLIA